MYWEWLGLPGTPISQNIDEMAKWVQWSMSGIMSGAIENEDAIRYNLNQFWGMKNQMYPTMSDAEKRQVDRLDMWSHALLNALDVGLMYAASPSYWEYLKAFWLGGTPPRPQTASIAAEAQKAALDAAQAANDVGLGTMATFFEREASNVATELADSNQFWNQQGVANPIGIPWYVWAAAGVIVLMMVKR